MKNAKSIGIIFTTLLFGCVSSRYAAEKKPTYFPPAEYTVNYGGCFGSDSLELKAVGDYLYCDKSGNLYFLTYDRSDENGKTVTPIFIQRFTNNCADYVDLDTTLDFSSYDLSNHIDSSTFTYLGDGYYVDKYNKYHFSDGADGGQFTLVSAATFEYIDKGFYRGSDGNLYIKTRSLIRPPEEYGPEFYRQVAEVDVASYEGSRTDGYSWDTNRVYYRYSTTDGSFIKILEGADRTSFRVIDPYRLAKDKDHVFDRDRIVEGLDPNLINSVEDFEKYRAADK